MEVCDDPVDVEHDVVPASAGEVAEAAEGVVTKAPVLKESSKVDIPRAGPPETPAVKPGDGPVAYEGIDTVLMDTRRISTGSETEKPTLLPMDNIPHTTATYNEAFDIRVEPDDTEHAPPRETLDEKMPKVLHLTHMQSAATLSCTTDEGLESFDKSHCAEEVKGDTERETEEHEESVVTASSRRAPAADPYGIVVEGGSSFVKVSQEIRGAALRMKIPSSRTSTDRPTRKGLDEIITPMVATGTHLPAPRLSLERPTRKTMDETETSTCDQIKHKSMSTPAADITHSQQSGSIATEKAPVTAHAPEWTNVDVHSTVAAIGDVSKSAQADSQQVESVATEKVPAITHLSGGESTKVGVHSTVSAVGDASEIAPAVDTAYSKQGENAAADNAPVTTHAPEGASANVGESTVEAVGEESKIAPVADIARCQQDERIVAENVPVTRHASEGTSIDDDVHPNAGAVPTTEEAQEGTCHESKLDDIDDGRTQAVPASVLENPARVDASTVTPAQAERGNVKATRRRLMRSHSPRMESIASDDVYAKFSDDGERVPVCDQRMPVCSKIYCVIF